MLKRTLLERLYYALFWSVNIQVWQPVMPFSISFGIRCVSGKEKTDYEGKENYCESKIISKTDLREVQGY